MAMQENGLNIIISLVLNDIKPLADERMELALEIKVGKFFHTDQIDFKKIIS